MSQTQKNRPFDHPRSSRSNRLKAGSVADGPAVTWPPEQTGEFPRNWCRGWESNPHDPCGSRDFKSRASVSFATPATRLNALNSLILPNRPQVPRLKDARTCTAAARTTFLPGQTSCGICSKTLPVSTGYNTDCRHAARLWLWSQACSSVLRSRLHATKGTDMTCYIERRDGTMRYEIRDCGPGEGWQLLVTEQRQEEGLAHMYSDSADHYSHGTLMLPSETWRQRS